MPQTCTAYLRRGRWPAAFLLALPRSPLARAQQLDPTFYRSEVYAPTTAHTAPQQPDGKIVVGGSFTRVGEQEIGALVRLTDTNVLRVASAQTASGTCASMPRPAPAPGA